MVKDILTGAGIPGRGSRHVKPPAGTYAVWRDDIETDGADDMPPGIYKHNVTVELYEPRPDEQAVEKLEAGLGARGLHWSKEDRFWIASEGMYQTIYNFAYIEKRRT